MIKNLKIYLFQPKSKIGFGHGLLSIIGAVILSYFSMMIFSKYIPGDYAVKIIPSIVLTPILISIFGLWLLFSQTVISSVVKFLIASIILFIFIELIS